MIIYLIVTYLIGTGIVSEMAANKEGTFFLRAGFFVFAPIFVPLSIGIKIAEK